MGYVKAVIRRSKKKSTGKIPIEIRITISRRAYYISTGCEIEEKYWEPLKSRIKKSHPNAVRTNNLISSLLSQSENHLVALQTEGKEPSIKEIKASVFNKIDQQTTLKGFSDDYLQELIMSKKMGRFSSERSRIKNILQFYKGNKAFKQINETSLRKFKVFLKAKFNHSERTIVNHLILLRTLFNRAITDGVISVDYYPFGERGLSIKTPESQKIGLEMTEVQLIENYSPKKNSTLWNARNVFLFSFYIAGARISDVLSIKWSDIKKDRLFYTMGKNNKVGTVKLTEKALEIIQLYIQNKKKGFTYVFPELNKCSNNDSTDRIRKINTATKKYNKWLGKMGIDLGIDKTITCHVARHTFGNISGDKISIQMLQKLYRHSSITTTVRYQQAFMNKETDDALEKVLNGE